MYEVLTGVFLHGLQFHRPRDTALLIAEGIFPDPWCSDDNQHSNVHKNKFTEELITPKAGATFTFCLASQFVYFHSFSIFYFQRSKEDSITRTAPQPRRNGLNSETS